MNHTSRNSQPGSTPPSGDARIELDETVTLHFQGNKAGALRALQQALERNPALANDPFTSNLAQMITGLPGAKALRIITDANQNKGRIPVARKERQEPLQEHRNLTYPFLLIGVFVLLIGFLLWSAYNRGLHLFNGRFTSADVVCQNSTLDGYYYYVSVLTNRTPKGGWPLVFAFHEYGADVSQVAPLAETFNEAGAIFVAASLGTYEPNPGNGPMDTVSSMLTKIGEEYTLQPRGAILLGIAEGGTFAYRFSVYHSDQVAGVVTAGAPAIDPILPARNIPYVFTWGEQDAFQKFALLQAQTIQNRGYNVRTVIVPGTGHELSRSAIEQVLLMLWEQ